MSRTDAKLAKLGFEKVREDKYGAEYIKDCNGYIQTVAILHKASGRHILQSYDSHLTDERGIGCTNVGLTYTELRVFAKKMREMKLKS